MSDECQHPTEDHDGQFISRWDNGNLKLRYTQKNGKIEGIYERYWQNGQLWQALNYVDGKRQGLGVLWDNMSSTQIVVLFKDDKIALI